MCKKKRNEAVRLGIHAIQRVSVEDWENGVGHCGHETDHRRRISLNIRLSM